MKITIQGQDYTSALDAAHPLTIERRLNEPSVCQLWLSIPSRSTLPAPQRNQSLAVSGDDGTVYFTGYLAVSPLPEYAGLGLEGPRYRIALQAISDELLLDQLSMAPGKGSASQTAGQLLTSLVTRTGSSILSTQNLSLSAPVTHYVPQPGSSWSSNAALVSSQARAAYRTTGGSLALNAIPGAVHTLSEADGSLTLANLTLTTDARRALANDVTVCGQHEPWQYITEYFLGDGVTTSFFLSETPYFPLTSQEYIIRELFNETEIDPRVWVTSSGGHYFSLGAGGLSMQGGSGIDGAAMLTWLDPIEMGGTLLLEATGVSLSPNSTGILAALFSGLGNAASCTAGFQVTAQSGTGAVSVQPLVMGSPTGTSYAINAANQYALRVRLRCPESHRVLSIFRSYGDDGPIADGGQWNLAPARLLFEIQEFVDGVAGMPVVLYDGSLANLPGSCMIAAASSLNLQGSMRSFNLTDTGSGWVVSTPPGDSPYTRRVGSATQGSECYVQRTGKLVFYPGFVPIVGEQIALTYRGMGRSVGRSINTASQLQLQQAGLPSVSAWIGTVTNPPARCSQDCRNAASIIAQAAASVSALWAGTYRSTRASFAADVWPGDALQLTAPSTNLDEQVVVRTVKLTYQPSYPDLVQYVVTFANDWANDLAIKTSTAVPPDTWLPAIAPLTVLSNLNALAVTSISGNSVTIGAGITPPPGGGFEIRRRDFDFQPGEDTELVMRSSEPTMTFTRVAASDRYYIRMYDGSTPPNYSEFSTALIFNLPLA
ncbi:MAG TPA: hypothetical protein VND90_01945 [Terracidiphilus sp.]|nr:hypothetical protein [Terracidiphilus sp.]